MTTKTEYRPIAFDITTQIPVMEHFYTLQGEGEHSGRAAYFIRLAGCDVGCTWCDVKESWPVESTQLMRIDELCQIMQKHPGRFAVITGGEPSLYDLNPLTTALKKAGFEIAIETSGTNALTGQLDWICLSPKKFKAPLPENFRKANELKVIAFNRHDFKWALELQELVSPGCRLYIQPEWDKAQELLADIIDFVKSNPQWTLSLQTHKYLNIP